MNTRSIRTRKIFFATKQSLHRNNSKLKQCETFTSKLARLNFRRKYRHTGPAHEWFTPCGLSLLRPWARPSLQKPNRPHGGPGAPGAESPSVSRVMYAVRRSWAQILNFSGDGRWIFVYIYFWNLGFVPDCFFFGGLVHWCFYWVGGWFNVGYPWVGVFWLTSVGPFGKFMMSYREEGNLFQIFVYDRSFRDRWILLCSCDIYIFWLSFKLL